MEVSYQNIKIYVLTCLLIHIHNCRFGTGVRTEKKRMDWPGPHDTYVPDYTTDGRKNTIGIEGLKKKTE
tara:strand:- start:243 stop:449 length:207 start_codon:yes stop_codon:yes gene_type:complete